VPLDAGEAKAAEMRRQHEAAVQQEQEKWAKLRRHRLSLSLSLSKP